MPIYSIVSNALYYSWSPVLTLKTLIYALKLFIVGALEEFEPQEILYIDSKKKANINLNNDHELSYSIKPIKSQHNNSRKRKFDEIEHDDG